MSDTTPAPVAQQAGPEDTGLEHRAARGLGYTILTFVCERGLLFAATLVLARLLVPEQFGVVAFAARVLDYLAALTDLGLGSAVIYRTDGTDDDVSSTSFWLSLTGAGFLAVAMFLAAPAIANVGMHDAASRAHALFRCCERCRSCSRSRRSATFTSTGCGPSSSSASCLPPNSPARWFRVCRASSPRSPVPVRGASSSGSCSASSRGR